MKKTIHKLFFIWNFDKEEQWLNQLAAQGLVLHSPGAGRYVFDVGQPGEYAVRLEMLDNWPSHPESVQYIRFVEETGAEYLGSVMRWVYFRKKKERGGFDLFSDIDSRIKHLNRILALATVLCIFMFFNAGNLLRLYLAGTGSVLPLAAVVGVVALVFLWGLVRLWRKHSRLKKERALHE